jgi:hypothetical protein
MARKCVSSSVIHAERASARGSARSTNHSAWRTCCVRTQAMPDPVTGNTGPRLGWALLRVGAGGPILATTAPITTGPASRTPCASPTSAASVLSTKSLAPAAQAQRSDYQYDAGPDLLSVHASGVARARTSVPILPRSRTPQPHPAHPLPTHAPCARTPGSPFCACERQLEPALIECRDLFRRRRDERALCMHEM